MEFVKMHGLGNDYIFADCIKQNKIDNPEELSIKISDRHKGVGSDGLIIISRGQSAEYRMDIYNADGSRAEMCGNGIRCVGKYLYDNGYVKGNKVNVETLCGIKYITLLTENGKCIGAQVDMGEPAIKKEQIPVIAKGETLVGEKVNVGGNEYEITCVSMGNPHCVVFVQNPEEIDIEKTGPLFENNEMFPKRINTEFVSVKDRTHITMRVWERGSAETMACGTGACAVAVAGVLTGRTDRQTEIQLRGGKLNINWDEETNHVFMTGPAETVCRIQWDD